MSKLSLLQDLATQRRRLGLRPEQIAELASILVVDVGRIERGDEDVRLDFVLAYAAALGCAISLRSEAATADVVGARTGAAAVLGADLDRLRAEFACCRAALELSATALARYCNLTAKTIFALERGPQIPKFSTAREHAERFGLVPSLCARDDRTPLPVLSARVAADRAAIYTAIGSTTKSASSHHLKAPRSEMEGAVAEVLVKAYEELGTTARIFAASIAVDWKTIAPEGVPSFTGRFGTTAKVAARLGFRIMAVPASLPLADIVAGRKATPADEPDLTDAQALAAARTIAARRHELGLGFADVHRLGGGSIKTTQNLETNPNNATLAVLCQHAAVLGLTLAVVPDAAAEDVGNAIGRHVPSTSRKTVPANGAARHFNPDVDARKRAMMAELCKAVADVGTKTFRDADLARCLGLPARAVEGLADGRRYRARAVEFAGLLRTAGAKLVFEDPAGGFLVEFGVAESGADEIRAFFDQAIVHRQGLGLLHGPAGEKVGISASRFQHMELGDPKILTTSLMLYAEALNLRWRIEGVGVRARRRPPGSMKEQRSSA